MTMPTTTPTPPTGGGATAPTAGAASAPPSNPPADAVAEHYRADALGQAIRDGLVALGKPLDRLTVEDLAPVDAFHIRGREATAELAQLCRLRPESQVLDVGSGIGGTARYLASAHGCQVNGVDLTEGFCALARELSALVGLSERTSFRQGDALALPFHRRSFDVVWTEHVQMNIADKRAFYAEALRVLRPGGTFAFHDIFAGEAGQPYFPAPWAARAELSALCRPAEAARILDELGCRTLHWVETTERSLAWFRAMLQRAQAAGPPPPLGLHLVMGADAPQKMQNLVRGLAEGRLTTVSAVLSR